MSSTKAKATLTVVVNSVKYAPANFGEDAVVTLGDGGVVSAHILSLYALDCAFNQGLATGTTLMNEEVKTLPIETISAAVSPGPKQPCWLGPKPPRRPRSQPLLVEHPTKANTFILVAGGNLIRQAAKDGMTELDCVVVPYHTAVLVGRALIDGFEFPRNGWNTLEETMPASEPAKVAYTGKDDSEEELQDMGAPDDEASGAKRLPTAAPAVSNSGITQGLDPHANLLLPLAIHTATIENGKVIVRANSCRNNVAVRKMLSRNAQKELDIVIELAPLAAGKAKKSLHELALELFLLHLFRRVKAMAIENKTGRAGHTLTETKRGDEVWHGSPTSFQNWIDVRGDLRSCSNKFWNASIPEELFRRCVALRYGVAMPTPGQLDAYLFKLIQAAFKALELASRQTSALRKLNAINDSLQDQPAYSEWRHIINQVVDGISDPQMGEAYQVNEVDRFMLAVLGRVNSAKIWRDKAHQTLMYQWLVAIGDLARTGQMVVSCLMAQEFVLVEIERHAGRDFDAGWMVFHAVLGTAVEGRCSEAKAHRALLLLCQKAMAGSSGMIVSRTTWGREPLVGAPLDEAASIAADTPILLF